MYADSTYRSVTLSSGQTMRSSDTIDQVSETKPRAAERILGVARKLFYLEGIRAVGVDERAVMVGYRGCGMTNAAVEYPEPGHPARLVGENNKRELRRRLRAMAKEMGAADPDTLGDGLLLLIEGAYISGQLFGPGGPAGSVAINAELLIEASLK